jgi:hypothetical protein
MKGLFNFCLRHVSFQDMTHSETCLAPRHVSFHDMTHSKTYLIPRRNERDMIKNVYRSSCKVTVILVPLYRNLNFPDRFSSPTLTSNFIKIRPVGAELLHADRRTNITNLAVAFRNFANAPKNVAPRILR